MNEIYALNLSEDGRIMSVTYDEYAPSEQPREDTLPDGDVNDYRYVDGEYVYDPQLEPEPEPAEPTAEEDLQAMAIDHEYRITLLELGLTE